MKIRISLNETSTAGSVYSAPSMESQEQQLPSDEELAIRDKEEADRAEQQAEKERKEAAKKAEEKAKKLPPADKAPGDSAAPKEDDAEEESEDDAGGDEDEDADDSEEDDSSESEDDEDLDDLDEDDEEATAAAIVVPDVPAPATPRNRPYPDAYIEAIPDAILPQKERELTEEEKAVQLEKENEKPQTDNADVILPEKPKENVGAPKTDNADGSTSGKEGDKAATQEVATASARQRPYPDCWD